LYRLVNVPKSEVRGAEVQAILTPAGGLTIATGLSYVKSKVLGNFSETNVYGSVQNFTGNSFPNTPKWQSSTDIDYRLSITDSLRGFVGAAATYQSRTSSQLGNLPLLVTKAYTLIDLRAGVEAPDGRWRFSLWGRNVGNSYYWSATNHTNDTTSRFTGKPATYGATFAYRFH
jgi:iron complex outermembrane recepter protein